MALRWLRLHPGAAIAPMHFPMSIAASDLPADVLAIVDALPPGYGGAGPPPTRPPKL